MATIANEITGEVFEEPIVEWPVRVLDGELKIVVALVKFIPEEEVRLRGRVSEGRLNQIARERN